MQARVLTFILNVTSLNQKWLYAWSFESFQRTTALDWFVVGSRSKDAQGSFRFPVQ